MTISLPVVLNGLGIVGIVGGAATILLSRNSKENSAVATELIDNLQKLRDADKEEFTRRITLLEHQHNENTVIIASLQGQITTLKDVPLRDLAKTMRAMSKDTKANAQSNAEILKTLLASATLLAQNTQHIADAAQTVKTDLVRDTENAANAVRVVKTDLKESK